MFVKDADPDITQDLERRGLLFRAERHTHTYPFRCAALQPTPRPQPQYIRTSQFKERMVELNQSIHWRLTTSAMGVRQLAGKQH